MPPSWKAGWMKAAFILFASLPLAAAITDPRVSVFDPPNGEYSHRHWESRPPSENAPSPRMAARYSLIDNYTTAFVGGGLDDNRFAEHWDLNYYDIATGRWQRMGVSPNGEMILPRDNFKMATINTETIKDLVLIMGGFWAYKENVLEIRDLSQFRSPEFDSEHSWVYPAITGVDVPPLYHGGCTTWKDLFIVYGGLKDVGSNDIYVLNVTSWTWSKPNVSGDPLPFAEDASMVVVPNWKGRDTIFIYSNSFTLLNDNIPEQTPCPGGRDSQYKCVFTVDLETWNAIMHVTPTPGPRGQFGSSTNLVSTDPHGNRYFYHYGGGYVDETTGKRIFSSDLNALRVEPDIDWVSVPVRNQHQIQGSWMGFLIGGLPQNMPAWIGEEPIVHIQGGQVGSPYVTSETHLTLGGISPIDSIINPPTVKGVPVLDVFQVQAGDYIQFTVDPRNAFGSPLPYGGDDVFGFLRRMDGLEKSCATVENALADTVQYIINCQVTLQGNYTFKIQIRDFPPIVPKYKLSVQPSSVSIAHSIAEGYGMHQANAGAEAIYKAKLYDVYGNRASVVSEEVHVAAVVGCNGNVSLAEAELLDANSFQQVDAVVTLDDPVNSLYTIKYIPETTGVCKVQNMVNNHLMGNVTYVVVGDPIPPPGFIALGSAAGATFMVLNIVSCLAACAASYHFGFKAKGDYRDGLIFSSGALALIGSLLYIGEPLDASCKARSAIGMMAFGMLVGVMFSQTCWYLGYFRTPSLAMQLPIAPKRALKYASAAVCLEGLLIIIVQTTAPIRRSIYTVNENSYIGCADTSGNKILYAHLALLCFLSVISFLTSAHKAPDTATSFNSIIGYNLTVLALFLVGLIGILRNEDLQIYFVLQSLDIWIACVMTFGLVIYSKVREGNAGKSMSNLLGGTGEMKTLAVASKSELAHSKSQKNQMMAVARPYLRQDALTQTNWKKCVYFHPNESPYGVIYHEFNKPGICLENIEDITSFQTDQSGLRYGLRLQIRGEETVLAFEKETDRAEYLEALKKIRTTKGGTNV